MILWLITDMNYQINDYYNNYFPGDTYEDSISIATVETLAYIFAGLIFEMFKTKRCTKLYILSYSICIAGGIAIWINNRQIDILDMALNFLLKFGIASAFQCCFLSNELFPIRFSSTTFGVCSMMGSISSILSIYEIYNSSENNPWILFISLAGVGMICAFLQREE